MSDRVKRGEEIEGDRGWWLAKEGGRGNKAACEENKEKKRLERKLVPVKS